MFKPHFFSEFSKLPPEAADNSAGGAALIESPETRSANSAWEQEKGNGDSGK